jgi:hypothetical protein
MSVSRSSALDAAAMGASAKPAARTFRISALDCITHSRGATPRIHDIHPIVRATKKAIPAAVDIPVRVAGGEALVAVLLMPCC